MFTKSFRALSVLALAFILVGNVTASKKKKHRLFPKISGGGGGLLEQLKQVSDDVSEKISDEVSKNFDAEFEEEDLNDLFHLKNQENLSDDESDEENSEEEEEKDEKDEKKLYGLKALEVIKKIEKENNKDPRHERKETRTHNIQYLLENPENLFKRPNQHKNGKIENQDPVHQATHSEFSLSKIFTKKELEELHEENNDKKKNQEDDRDENTVSYNSDPHTSFDKQKN